MTPRQTWQIIETLANPLDRILILTCAATALRASELLALCWADVPWYDGKITQCWSRGKDMITLPDRTHPMGALPYPDALALTPDR